MNLRLGRGDDGNVEMLGHLPRLYGLSADEQPMRQHGVWGETATSIDAVVRPEQGADTLIRS